MRQILFIQGGGKDVHEHWDQKLVESLRRELGPGYEIRYPVMPREDDPDATTWGIAIEREIAALKSGAIVVGHSIGGTILINVLAGRASATSLGAIILIAAPFIGRGGWQSDDIKSHSELGGRLPEAVPVFLYHGEADTTAPVSHAALYAAVIPHAKVRQLANRDHQLNDDLSEVARDIRDLSHGPAVHV